MEREIVMTYPYDNNWNVPESGSQNNGWTNPTQPQEPPMQTAWSGSLGSVL